MQQFANGIQTKFKNKDEIESRKKEHNNINNNNNNNINNNDCPWVYVFILNS